MSLIWVNTIIRNYFQSSVNRLQKKKKIIKFVNDELEICFNQSDYSDEFDEFLRNLFCHKIIIIDTCSNPTGFFVKWL